MSATQLVFKEICNSACQRDLLACRRTFTILSGGPALTRRQDLADDLMDMARCPLNRQNMGMDLLTGRDAHSLRLLISRLRGLGCLVPLSGRPRIQDMLAAIMRTADYAPRKPPSAHTVPAAAPMAPSAPTAGKGLCPSPPVGAATTTLVAYDTAAEPAMLQRKLKNKWSKKWTKFCKKRDRKGKLANVKVALQGALGDAQATTTVGDLRAIVGQMLGITLDGKNRLAFDQALFELTGPPPKKKRHRMRFRIANKHEIADKRARGSHED